MPETPTPNITPGVIDGILEILAEYGDQLDENEHYALRLALEGLRTGMKAQADRIEVLEYQLRGALQGATTFLQDQQPAAFREHVTQATVALAERRVRSSEEEQVDNSRLPAGAQMHYYCHGCGLLAETLPEDWWKRPPKKLCSLCEKDRELLGLTREP